MLTIEISAEPLLASFASTLKWLWTHHCSGYRRQSSLPLSINHTIRAALTSLHFTLFPESIN